MKYDEIKVCLSHYRRPISIWVGALSRQIPTGIACGFIPWQELERWRGAWIAVASDDHVRIGRKAGFMQVCHGKAAPLRKIAAGDRVVYDSSTVTFGGWDRLQAFTTTGLVRDSAPYQVEITPVFCPWRRDVAWASGMDIAIRLLLPGLAFAEMMRAGTISSGSGCFPSRRKTPI